MTDTCPDCGRPRSGDDEPGLIATHCLRREGDFLGAALCKDNTIAKLRRDLAAAQAAAKLTEAERDYLDALYEFIGWEQENAAESFNLNISPEGKRVAFTEKQKLNELLALRAAAKEQT